MFAFILAAGLGTRLKPLTDRMPKALVPVAGKPLLEHQILRLKAAGCTCIVVNIHHFGDQIIDFLRQNDNFGMDIRISDEREMLLDTGGALKKGLLQFPYDAPVLVHNVDILHNIDLRQFYANYADTADAALLVTQRETSRYLYFDEQQALCAWQNVRTGATKYVHHDTETLQGLHAGAFSGIHIFDPRLERTMRDWPDKFSIIDFYLQAAQTHRIIGAEMSEAKILDVGKIDTLETADQFVENT